MSPEGGGKKDRVKGRKMSTEGGGKTDIGETIAEIIMMIEDMVVTRVTWIKREKKSIIMKEVHLIDLGMNVNVACTVEPLLWTPLGPKQLC